MSPQTYMQTHNPTVEQGEGTRGKGVEGTPPLGFSYNKTGQNCCFFILWLSLED